VGYKLYREVRDYAPAGWSQSELVVAWVIADDANDDTRQSWIALALLCAYSRLTERGVRAALHRMASGGHEFRVIHGYGKDGRPVFAAKGHAVDYLVPDMLKGGTVMPPIAVLPVDNPAQRRHGDAAYSESKAARNGPKGGTKLLKGGTVVPPLSSDPLTTTSTLTSVVTTSVEGSKLSTGQDPDQPSGHQPSRLEREALRQVTEARATRTAKEAM
jgi:hypothetical protein